MVQGEIIAANEDIFEDIVFTVANLPRHPAITLGTILAEYVPGMCVAGEEGAAAVHELVGNHGISIENVKIAIARASER